MFKRLNRPAIDPLKKSLENVLAFYRFHVGDHEILVINDGFIGVQVPVLAANASEKEVLSLMEAHALRTDFAALPIGIVLVRTGKRLVLVDNGFGSSDFSRELFGDYIGSLIPTLKILGVSPEAITDVIFSHSHADHLGGTTVDGQLVFSNAQHYLPQLEWEDLQRENIPEIALPFYEFAREQLRPLEANDGQLSLFGDGEELVPGIHAFATYGHSAGHHALLIESGNQQLLLPFDVLAHPVLHLRHPEWYMQMDQVPNLAVQTRKKLLSRVADEKLPVLAHHFPFPGLGNITREGDAYRFTPTS